METHNDAEKDLNNILIWHFIWSKYYFSTKKRGKILSLIIFTPLLLRINLKIILYKIFKNNISLNKYKYRLNGLVKSMMGKSSDLRP